VVFLSRRQRRRSGLRASQSILLATYTFPATPLRPISRSPPALIKPLAQSDASGGCSSAFVTKVNPTEPPSSTPPISAGSNGLGETSYDIGLDANDDVYLTGITGSPNFPATPGAFQTQCGTDGLCNGTFDGFVTELNPTRLSRTSVNFLRRKRL